MTDNGRGFFDLSGFEQMDENATIKISESTSGEFANNSYAKTGADNHIPGAAGTEMGPKPPQSSTQPGETVKKPTGEGEKGPKAPNKTAQPGETTVKSVPRHEMGPSTPKATVLTTNEWNASMKALKQSFKEGMELMEMLENARIVDERPEDKQKNFMEEAMFDAMFEAMEAGPIFESVQRSDKHEVSAIVKKVRKKVKAAAYSDKLSFNDAKYTTRCLHSALTSLGAVGLAAAANFINPALGKAATSIAIYKIGSSARKILAEVWSIRLWQFVGTLDIEPANVGSFMTHLNKELADELGDYKLIQVAAMPSLGEVIADKFGWKSQKGIYFILVDKKLDSEMKKDMNRLDKAFKAGLAAKDKKKDGKKDEEAIKESVDEVFAELLTEKKKEDKSCPECGCDPCECKKGKKCKDDDEDDEDEKKKDKKKKKKNDDDEDDD